MTGRREFLQSAGAVLLAGRPVSAALRRARHLVRRGGLGAVRFCRVQHAGLLPAVRFVLDGAGCVIEVDGTRRGAALLGSEATLQLDQTGYQVFGRNG